MHLAILNNSCINSWGNNSIVSFPKELPNGCHYLYDQLTFWSLFHVISIPFCPKTRLGPKFLKK